jgi:hypothetical protein
MQSQKRHTVHVSTLKFSIEVGGCLHTLQIVLRHLAHHPETETPDMLSLFPHYALFNAYQCHCRTYL